MAIRTTDNTDEDRFEIYVDDALAGFASYHERPGIRAFVHTEIDPAFAGQGLGGKLITAALEAARTNGDEVLPFCSFVGSFIEKHDDYLDLVPTEMRKRFGLE